jgi:hypothetical protein
MCVLKEGKTYYMFAESKDDIAHLLTSTDRIHWKDQGAIDIRLKNGSPLSKGPYGTPAVRKEKGIWYLFYERNDAAVWLATSKDLKTWTNVQDEPVLNAGPEKYDAFAVAFNKIIQHKGLYYAYYHASAFKDWREWTMNVAVSKDLVHWKKYEGNPIVGNDSSSGFPVFDGKQWRFTRCTPTYGSIFPKNKMPLSDHYSIATAVAMLFYLQTEKKRRRSPRLKRAFVSLLLEMQKRCICSSIRHRL